MLTLHSIPFYSNTVRASETGPLWMQDARLVEGRWVVPGAVSVFTGRGKRALMVSTNEDDPTANEGFLVPLPARPSARDLEWSEWLPRARPGTAPINKLTYRFRVRRSSQPVRTEVIGDWEIGTAASSFYRQAVNGVTVTGAGVTAVLDVELGGAKVVPQYTCTPPMVRPRIRMLSISAAVEEHIAASH